MGFRCGIVGLPNVGKSTLFNALTETAAAQAANYPFCTIEPNVGNVGCARSPPRHSWPTIAHSARKSSRPSLALSISPAWCAGASKGEGLGNQFLGNIREVDAIVHVLRCFENDDIHACRGQPYRSDFADAETVETELMLVRPRKPGKTRAQPRRRRPIRKAIRRPKILASVRPWPGARTVARRQAGAPDAEHQGRRRTARLCNQAQLLTAKPVLYVCNVDEDECRRRQCAVGASVFAKAKGRRRRGGRSCRPRSKPTCAAMDARRTAGDFLAEIGPVTKPGSNRVIHRRIRIAQAPDHVFHRRAKGNPRLDRAPCRRARAAGGGRNPHRFRTRLHPRRNDRL